MSSSLPFHHSINTWFEDQYSTPTEVQKASWPVIVAGHNALITAPTGSGKTLTAFMWSLSQFASGHYQSGQTKVLYISPLKALNNDIQRNLIDPIQTLEQSYELPALRVQTRSGDTSQGDRQRMLRKPPDILITTPESLGLLMTTTKGRQALSNVETLILDEIHAIVDNRRGAQLMVNVERLVDLAGEFQRIALSATVAPLADVADYVAGFDAKQQRRRIEIINTPGEKQIDLRIVFPAEAKAAAENGKKIWEPLSESFRSVINDNNSTLLFTNSRRLAEKITLKINQDQETPLAYAHHGSLARDVRFEVERRLKAGELKAIVATNSLEMGIDIGQLDRVVLVQSPPSVAATLQRIGRAGHRVGEVSYGTLFPTHAHDFLEAAVLAQAVEARDIEPQQLMRAPLDVLAQIIISMCATDAWPVDDLFRLITRATPYRSMPRHHFDLVVEMLAGRYAGSRIRELKPRVVYDRLNRTIKANRGAVLAMYSSGGTIPDRGYYQLRHVDNGSILGELDEEFVWEATVGQTFAFGTQHWQIHRITHNDVMVRPAPPDASAPPFWRSEFFNRSFHFSNRITQYLEMAEHKLAHGEADELRQELEDSRGFDPLAAQELVDYLKRQRAHTESALPHRHHLLVEHVHSGPAGYRGPDDPQQIVIHTYWGGRLNQPWALALQAAWHNKYQTQLEIHADNDAIVAQCKGDIDPHALLTLVTPERLPELIRTSLEHSGFFGARFRECAGRALLLTKQRFSQRLPLWMSRLQAKKLMAQVKKLDEFPVLLETWRTCLDDEFDLQALNSRLAEIGDGTMTWSYVRTRTPSPFAHNLTFGQVSRYMYADDTPEDDALSILSADLIGQALHNDALRPKIEQQIIDEFQLKRQRRQLGYEPNNAEEWGEWLKERILIPAGELPDEANLPDETHWLELGERRWATHAELIFLLHDSGLVPGPPPTDAIDFSQQSDHATFDSRDAPALAREILSFYGPLTEAEITRVLPTLPDTLLSIDESYICGQLIAERELTYWCDAENFEILMRFQRASRRAIFEALDPDALPGFWAGLQRLGSGQGEASLLYAIESLRGFPTQVSVWLNDLLPARILDFLPMQWDDTLARYGLAWLGTGKESITIAYPEELELYTRVQSPPEFTAGFVDPSARYTFGQIVAAVDEPAVKMNEIWWQAVWQGQVSCDTLTPLLQATQRKFQLSDNNTPLSSRRRMRRPHLGWQGNWYLNTPISRDDPLSILEADKERVRILMDRYGFINRDIVNRENLPSSAETVADGAPKRWRWREAFRALRVMELGGEVLTGHFFKTLSTPQFITPRALSVLQTNTPQPTTYWLSALDPASPCGLSLDWSELPQRRIGNYLVFHGAKLACVVENNGRGLSYHVSWEHDAIDSINAVLEHLVKQRRMRVQIQSINALNPRSSPYLASLERLFNVMSDHKYITLEPPY